MAIKKKPSALNSAKKKVEELEAQIESSKKNYEALNNAYVEQLAANKALYKSLDEAKKEKQQFDEETSEYEGMRKFLLGKLKNKRPEYVNSLFINVKESINTGISCKVASLKEELKSLESTHEKLSAEMRKAEGHRL